MEKRNLLNKFLYRSLCRSSSKVTWMNLTTKFIIVLWINSGLQDEEFIIKTRDKRGMVCIYSNWISWSKLLNLCTREKTRKQFINASTFTYVLLLTSCHHFSLEKVRRYGKDICFFRKTHLSFILLSINRHDRSKKI